MPTAALAGSSTKLAKSIVDTMSAAKQAGRVPDQAHHLLSSNVIIKLDAEFHANGHPDLMAASAGYLLNAKPNGILLPTHFGHQMKVKLQRHCGNHYKVYYKNVEAVVRKVYDRYDGKDVCSDGPVKKNFLGAMTAAENTVRGNIKSRTWWLYDWSEPLWDGDYRDEGTGNLNVSRGPVIDQEAGLDWLKQKAGDIKRRWIETGTKKKKVVNKAWYASHTYPAPSRLT